MVGLRRGDENIQTFDVRGTAFDSSTNGDYIVVAGHRSMSVVLPGCPPTSWLRLRMNRQIVRQVRLNPIHQNVFACVSGQEIDLYDLGKSCVVQNIVSFCAQSRKISDFNWCPNNENLMVCCADNDTVSFWDMRDTSKQYLQLDLVFGASQAKFSPFFEDILLSTHGCDMRLWDLRRVVQPINQFTGHEYRIQCLQWHPQEQNMFATSAIDGFLKLWDLTDQKCVPKISSVGSINTWRFSFSPDGDELASISLPSVADASNLVTIFSNSAMDNPQPLKNDSGDTILDICWYKQMQKSTKYLYTLTKRSRLCRHPVAYELTNEVRDEMATPIAQSAVDEERDRLIAEHADEAAAAAAAAAVAEDDAGVLFGAADEEDSASGMTADALDTGKKFSAASQKLSSSLYGGKKFLSNSQLNSIGLACAGGRSNKPSIGISFESNVSPQNPTLKLANTAQTPQSPIVSEWSRWITAPNKTGGDLLTELEAIRKPRTEGLYTTEVNFQRAAIGFSYRHWNKCRKINFEMRFHKFFIENGLVFVEVLQKDSPLAPEKATLFLTLLQQESDEQAKIASESTILSRVFVQLPKLVESMKIFTPSIDVPNLACKSVDGCALNTSYDQNIAELADSSADAAIADESGSIASAKPSTAVDPVIYTPSPYDLAVPIPRTCGARFNGSGFLVMFGSRANYSGKTGGASGAIKIIGCQPRISKSSLSEAEKQHIATASSSVGVISNERINSFRRRSFQQLSSRCTKRIGDSPQTSARSKDEQRHRHYPSTSSEIPHVISSAIRGKGSVDQTSHTSIFTHSRHHHSQQRTRGGILSVGLNNHTATSAIGGASQPICDNHGTAAASHHHRRYRHSVHQNPTSSGNFCFGIPRSLADYCILVPSVAAHAHQSSIGLANSAFASKHIVPALGLSSLTAAAPDSSSLSSLHSSACGAEHCASEKNDDENTQNPYSYENSCNTSPSSFANMFSSSVNTVVALDPRSTGHSQTSAQIIDSSAGEFAASQPVSISATPMSSALHRNSSIKSASKTLSSSPGTCGVCGPSVSGASVGMLHGMGVISGSVGSTTTRSFSLQNVAHSARHRGNSMTSTAAAAAATAAATAGTPGASDVGAIVGGNIVCSAGTAFPTNSTFIMEEHAVMPELSFCSTVFVYDAIGLLPVSKDLAAGYKLLGGNALELCRQNIKCAHTMNRPDLIRVWKILEQCILSSNKEKPSSGPKDANTSKNPIRHSLSRTPWSIHPFGRELVNNMLDHFFRSYDFQTAAMITCILGNRRHRNGRQRAAQLTAARQLGSYSASMAASASAAIGAVPTALRYKLSTTAGSITPIIPTSTADDTFVGGGGSVHSRSLSASLAPSGMGGQPHSSRAAIDYYNPILYSSYGERAGGGFSGVNDTSECLKLARSNSFENDGLPLMISMAGTENVSYNHAQSAGAVAMNSGGNATGPPSRKTSNSIGLAPFIPFASMLRKFDHSSVTNNAMMAAATTTTTAEQNESISSKEQSPQQQQQAQNFRQSRSMNFTRNLYMNATRSSAYNNLNTLDYYYDFVKDDSFNELLLDPQLAHRFEDVRLQYADVLYRWGMYLKCAEVMKYCSTPVTNTATSCAIAVPNIDVVNNEEIIGVISEISWCNKCEEPLRHTYKCPNCKRAPLNCAICEEPCYGTTVTCTMCSHGGHLSHMARWFDAQTTCPLNCGCECRV